MIRAAGLAALPLVALVAVIGLMATLNPLATVSVTAPPIETLTVERTVLDEGGISLLVRASGSEPLAIAQVQVDGAFWRFAQEPPGPLARLATAWIRIPYPWVGGERHKLVMISRTGATFEHAIAVAVASPKWSLAQMRAYTWIGFVVGFVPVSLGMLFYPLLQRLSRRGFEFTLALTVGLLLFLLIDTLAEGLELAGGAAPEFQGAALVWLVAGLTFLTLMAIGRRGGHAPEGIALATYIALGVGLHNLGEGLAVGAAFAAGEAALGAFLVVGFVLHNLTEGVGIVAPLTEDRPHLYVFPALAALAGLPAIAGAWAGSVAYAPHLAALFLGVGAGAILQVVVEVGSYLARRAARTGASWLSASTVTGTFAGVAVMYATAFLVKF
ncbi:MAG: metal transporter [Proteobacteria bacterium]|nr:metal transporter [Pseudomonadota bacterium]